MLRLFLVASIAATALGGKKQSAHIAIDGQATQQGSALDREIQALDDLIKVQQKKLAALGALRRAGAPPAEDDEGTCAALRQASREIGCGSTEKRRAREAPKDVDDVLVTRSAVGGASVYEILPFRTRARPSPQPRRKRGQMPPRAARYDYVNVLCVVAPGGVATFYESSGDVIATVDLGQKNVKAVAFDGADQPLLVTANDDSVRVHNLTLWKGERVVAGRRPRRAYDEADETAPIIVEGPVERTASGLGLVIGREVDLAPSTVQVSTKKGTVDRPTITTRVAAFPWRSLGTHVAILDDGNQFTLYMRNGTRRGVLNVTGTVIARASSTLAVADKSVVRFVSAGRWSLISVECRGPPSTISDVVFDPLRPELVHVAYVSGEILTFRKPPQYGYDDDERDRQCRLIGKVPSSPHASLVKLAALRGFLVSASSSHVAVHNTSASPEHYYLVGSKAVTGKKTDLRATVVSGMYSPEVLLAFKEDNTIALYESLLKHEPPAPPDVSWMRVPILLIGLVVVFGVQVFRGGTKRQARGRGGLSTSEMDQLNQMAGLMGGGAGFPPPGRRPY